MDGVWLNLTFVMRSNRFLDRLADKGAMAIWRRLEVMRWLTAIVNDNIDSDALVDIKPPSFLVTGMSKLKQAMLCSNLILL